VMSTAGSLIFDQNLSSNLQEVFNRSKVFADKPATFSRHHFPSSFQCYHLSPTTRSMTAILSWISRTLIHSRLLTPVISIVLMSKKHQMEAVGLSYLSRALTRGESGQWDRHNRGQLGQFCLHKRGQFLSMLAELARYLNHYESSPMVLANIWYHLTMTDIVEARVTEMEQSTATITLDLHLV
jgi:hypothetical protein